MSSSIRCTALFFAIFSLCLLGVPTASAKTKTGLTGVVFDPADGVLPDASVTVFCRDRAFGTGTNGDGAFEFAELPPGTYTVWVTRESFVSQTIENVQIVDGQTRQIAITLKIASTSCFPEASTSYEKRSDDVNLAGKVSGSSDGPLKGATIKLTPMPSGQNRVTTTRQDGTFQFSGLEPGRYKLQAIHRGYSGASVTELWITRENLTRIAVISLIKSGGPRVIICQ